MEANEVCLGISFRAKLIVNYLTTKGRLEPLFELAQHYKYNPRMQYMSMAEQ